MDDASQRLVRAGEKAKRLVRLGAEILVGTVAIATIIGTITNQRLKQATLNLQSTELAL
ncbi:MAG: hypothetical protein AAGD25_37005 [Cyanobacteria bacterium P01_F01_bin.150]